MASTLQSDPKKVIEQTEISVVEKQEQIVSLLIETCWKSAKNTEDLPISIGDLIRLFQFQRETEKTRPADVIEVRWIDPNPENQP
jgi:hypothetical protein